MIITTDIIIGIRSKQVELVFKSVWEKSPFLANFRLLLKRKILLTAYHRDKSSTGKIIEPKIKTPI